MPLQHNGDHQFAVSQSVCNFLPVRSRTALNIQSPRFCGGRDQRVIGAAARTPIAVFIRPSCHLDGVNGIVCQRGYNDGHRRRPTAVAADIVSAIRLPRIAFIQLIEIDDLGLSVRKADITERGNRCIPSRKPLKHTVPEEQTEVIRIIVGKVLLLGGQMEYLIGKVGFTVVGNGINDPLFRGCRYGFRCDFLAGRGIYRYRGRDRFNCAFLFLFGIGIELVLAAAQHGCHIRYGHSGIVLVLCRTVLSDKLIGVEIR